MRRLAGFRPSPGTVIAVVAVFLVGAGSATAARLITGKQIKDSSITGRDVKDRSLTPKDFKGSVRGAAGPAGAKGETGPAGPLLDTLPSGRTLRGVWGLQEQDSTTNFASTEISFPISLASAPTEHLLVDGAVSPSCPGSAQSPEAAPGHLCIWERAGDATTSRFVADPTTNLTNEASRYGAVIVYGGAGTTFGRGTWAVTAP